MNKNVFLLLLTLLLLSLLLPGILGDTPLPKVREYKGLRCSCICMCFMCRAWLKVGEMGAHWRGGKQCDY